MRQLLKTAALGFAIAAGATGCSSTKDANAALEDAGYSNVKIDGYKFFGCGQDDTFHTEFHATNAKGKTVHGVVCSGWLKGGTIRTLD